MIPHPSLDDSLPHLFVSGLPYDEQDTAWHLASSLDGFGSYIKEFSWALSLFDACALQIELSARVYQERQQKEGGDDSSREQHLETMRKHFAWQCIAAHDGALSIFNCSEVMTVIRSEHKNCPTLSQFVDVEKLRLAAKLFRSYFQNAELIRGAVGHPALLMGTEEHRQRNAPNTPGFFITNGLAGRTYVTTNRGRVISYEISSATLDKLIAVKRMFYAGFTKAISEVNAMPALPPRARQAPGEPQRSG